MIMMQHQPSVKRVDGAHESAHRPYQLLITAACYKHRRQDERQPPQKSRPVPICTETEQSQVTSFLAIPMLCLHCCIANIFQNFIR